MSSLFNSIMRNGINKSFFRIYAPKQVKKSRVKSNEKRKENQGKFAENEVYPDFCVDLRGSYYIPLETKSLEAFGNWSFKVAEVTLEEVDKALSLEHLFGQNSVVLLVHGFTDTLENMPTRNLVDAYLRRGDHTVMVLDWTVAQNSPYAQTVVKIPFIAKSIAQSLDKMLTGEMIKDLTLDKVHVVAHSLGCHLAAYISKNLTIGKFKRITALDPAKYIYQWLKRGLRISEDSAIFVDVIHTDAGKLGMKISCGHADFFPNGGRRFQPGCSEYYSIRVLHPITTCSHSRSWQYYAESVTSDPSNFLSCKASDWKAFQEGDIDDSEKISMGFYASDTACGNYYLQTNSLKPFGRGENGLQYHE